MFQRYLFKFIRYIIKVIYPKTMPCGIEKLPSEPCIVVGNHSQMHAPIVCELYFPTKHKTWCAGEMMKCSDVPSYAYRDFWSKKPRAARPFYRLLSFIIAPIAPVVFNNADTIGVYHDTRLLKTFRETVQSLDDGYSIVIFPEYDEKHNNIVYKFQDKFVDVAKLYYKKTGKELKFVPMYLAPRLRCFCFGEPTSFCPSEDIEKERERICRHLSDEITSIATSLPEHTVVPYRNISKKDYPKNTDMEISHEKAHS